MKYMVVCTEYRNAHPKAEGGAFVDTETEERDFIANSVVVGKTKVGEYDSKEAADQAIAEAVDYFREHHDNDERINWSVVEVTDDIGNRSRFVWDIVEIA